MSNLLIHFVVGGSIAAIITIVIRILLDMKSPTEVLKQELTINDDDVNLIIKTEGKINPTEVLDMIEGVDKGIMTVNEVRTKAKFEPFNEFQKIAHDFGDTTKAEFVGGSTIRKVSNCPNCGGNLTQNGVCVYCGTYYE